jgi:thimet oligopeptidase
MVARMNRADTFGRAGNAAIQNALSAISYEIHRDSAEKADPEAITLKALRRYTVIATPDSDAHFYASFTHLADYSSAYYTYLWDQVIAEDFFQQFDQKNLFSGDAPLRYRRLVLEPGGSMSANDLVRNFLGRPQSMAAFEKWMAAEFETGVEIGPAVRSALERPLRESRRTGQ